MAKGHEKGEYVRKQEKSEIDSLSKENMYKTPKCTEIKSLSKGNMYEQPCGIAEG